MDSREESLSRELCGQFKRVGSAVKTLEVGDKVVVMAPTPFATFVKVPEWACQKLQDNEDPEVLLRLSYLPRLPFG